MGLGTRVVYVSINQLRTEIQTFQKYANDQSVPEIVRTLCANKLKRHWTVLQREMLKGRTHVARS